MSPDSAGYRAALYMRLSRDDEGAGESSSITTQRKMLRSYAQEKSFPVYREYADDGFSGTNFDRPGFQSMIKDIEEKKVNLVITKDLSRLGRDYITTGQFTEIYFPSKGVRYIAVNDGYDSESLSADIAPFKNVMNEMYARDISKKIRSAFAAKMKDGCYIGSYAPFGYQKDPDNKNHLMIDKTAAPVVQTIFALAAEGKTPIQIARYLNERAVLPPALYRCQKYSGLPQANQYRNREWSSATVSKILCNIVYLGHLAQGKTAKLSFKSHVTIQKQKEEWILVRNTHEPLIQQETYDRAQQKRKSRACQKNGGFSNIFSGIAKCADCGRNMSTVGSRKKASPANLACGAYKLNGCSGCSNHFIDFNVLSAIVLETVREQVKLSGQEKRELLEELQRELEQSPVWEENNRKLHAISKRIRELDAVIEKLYEDTCQRRISEERFQKMLKNYEAENQRLAEQKKYLEEAGEREKTREEFRQQVWERFSDTLKAYLEPEALTQELLCQFVERIEIGQGYFEQDSLEGRVRHQRIKIYFRFCEASGTKQFFYG